MRHYGKVHLVGKGKVRRLESFDAYKRDMLKAIEKSAAAGPGSSQR